MSLLDKQHQVLHILSENSKKPQPQVVDSTDIAEELHLGISEIQQLIKVLNQSGVIESDQDGQYSLITPHGVHWLMERQASRVC